MASTIGEYNDGELGNVAKLTSTFPSKESAKEVASKLVKERLAACCQVYGPIESTYIWKGEIENDKEWVLIVKTSLRKYKEVLKEIRNSHPYEIPEIVVEVVSASSGYAEWVGKVI